MPWKINDAHIDFMMWVQSICVSEFDGFQYIEFNGGIVKYHIRYSMWGSVTRVILSCRNSNVTYSQCEIVISILGEGFCRFEQ